MKRFFYFLAVCLPMLVLSSCDLEDENDNGGGSYNGHEYVDLGLSVKWATCNVGASSPEEYGNYFAWGEITPKSIYYWSTYKYCNGSSTTMTKYCTSSSYGTVDDWTTLNLSDDAAHAHWGGNWRMPTEAEQNELINNCTWTWTTDYRGIGVSGYIVKSKTNSNSIFLPATGYCADTNLEEAGSFGTYWSSSLYLNGSDRAYYLGFDSGDVARHYGSRYYGRSVRAVCQ